MRRTTLVPTLKQLSTLIGNPNAYAQQFDKEPFGYAPVYRVDKETGEVKADVKDFWQEALTQHVEGVHTIGTYIVRGDQARTLTFDVDSGDDAKGEIVRLRKTLSRDWGFPADTHLVVFSGSKGYHLWLLFPTFVPANHLRRMGRAVAAQAEVNCEVYPKQDEAVELGNLVKLPYAVHRKTGRRAELLTGWPRFVSKREYEAAVAKLPEEKRYSGSAGSEAYPCLTKIQGGGCDGGRNKALYHMCVLLRRGGLSDDNLWDVAERTNNQFDTPLKEPEFRRTVESAIRGGGPLCNNLDPELHCGDLCIVRREKGLYMRPHQMRYAGEGELVVLQIKKRDGTVVELDHPDLAVATAKVAETKE